MILLAIDPGDVQSAWVLYDNKTKKLIDFAKEDNDIILNKLSEFRKKTDKLALEMIASYGFSVGKTVFETCVWIGRYWQEWNGDVTLIYRKDVKMYLCHSMKAKDSNVRQALIDLFPRAGISTKGEPCAIGCKKTPGPLYSMAKDTWAALGVAMAFAEKLKVDTD